ncbi:hypothetical protein FB451DRAFT_1284716 [Mycena latifolia]|nr:hypothetical protein FB451DRAFT_1284716 [Mycena latifolia]
MLPSRICLVGILQTGARAPPLLGAALQEGAPLALRSVPCSGRKHPGMAPKYAVEDAARRLSSRFFTDERVTADRKGWVHNCSKGFKPVKPTIIS